MRATAQSSSSQLQERPANNLIRRMTEADYDLIAPFLDTHKAKSEDLLYNPGDDVETVHFPCESSLASYLVPNEDGRDVEAILVGPDRAVVQSSSGLVALVDLAKKQAISAVTGSSTSQFFMHPSRQLIGVMTANGTAMLLRTSDFAILGEYPNASGQGNVAVDPSGEYCAYPTTAGPVRVVKIADGSELALISVGAAFNGRLDLADDKFLIVNGSTVYEVKSGLPVWIYQLRQNTMFTALPSGQFLLAEPGNGMTSMAIVTIPDQIGRAALKSASPDRFMLKPGTSIKIDGDFGAFGDDRQKASDAVATAVQTAGINFHA